MEAQAGQYRARHPRTGSRSLTAGRQWNRELQARRNGGPASVDFAVALSHSLTVAPAVDADS
ncbi:MAG: hypothetical protein QOH20_3700 [Mycobacterium sp.]|nr:hypothetical protein [Mycobacterium sp.]